MDVEGKKVAAAKRNLQSELSDEPSKRRKIAEGAEEAAPSTSGVRIGDEQREILALSRAIDENLELKARAHNLTAINVKSILHHLIKNPSVISTLMGISGGGQAAEALSYELKLTRSKARELAERAELTWPASPLKEPAVASRTFLDVDYGDDDDDDDEYDPAVDPAESDDDADAALLNASAAGAAPQNEAENWSNGVSDGRSDSPKLVIASAPNMDLPAHHTRSKESLTEVSLDMLDEALPLVDPDVTLTAAPADLSVDTDYADFLLSLHGGGAPVEDDADLDDPEYHYLGDADETAGDEMRRDRATEIPKREVTALLQDLFQILSDRQPTADESIRANFDLAESETARTASSDGVALHTVLPSVVLPNSSRAAQPEPSAYLVSVHSDCLLNDFGRSPLIQPCEREQLEDQMRKHVQLLLQAHLLSRSSPSLEYETNLSQRMLVEMDFTRGGRREAALTVANVDCALQTAAAERCPLSAGQLSKLRRVATGRRVRVAGVGERALRAVPPSVMHALAHSAAVAYPHLLPICAPLFLPATSSNEIEAKHSFKLLPCEDRLLAMGCLQFSLMGGGGHALVDYEQVAASLLPVYGAHHLRQRFRTLTRSRAGENPVEVAHRSGCWPNVPRHVSRVTCGQPVKWPIDLKPAWLIAYSRIVGDDCAMRKGKAARKLRHADRRAPSRSKPTTDGGAVDANVRWVVDECQKDRPAAADCFVNECTDADSPCADANVVCVEINSPSPPPPPPARLSVCAVADRATPPAVTPPRLAAGGALPSRRSAVFKAASPLKLRAIRCLNRFSPKHNASVSRHGQLASTSAFVAATPPRDEVAAVAAPSTSLQSCEGKTSRKRTKAQRQRAALDALYRRDDAQTTNGLCQAFLADMKRGLFMHGDRYDRLVEVVLSTNAHNVDPLDSYEAVFGVLCGDGKSSAVPPFARLLSTFLPPPAALQLSNWSAYQMNANAVDALLKLERYMTRVKGRAQLRATLRQLNELNQFAGAEAVFEQVGALLASEPLLLSQLRPLFPDAPFDLAAAPPETAFETITRSSLSAHDGFEDVSLQCSVDKLVPPVKVVNGSAAMREGARFVAACVSVQSCVPSALTDCVDWQRAPSSSKVGALFSRRRPQQKAMQPLVAVDDEASMGALVSAADLPDNSRMAELLPLVDAVDGAAESSSRLATQDILRSVMRETFGNSRLPSDAAPSTSSGATAVDFSTVDACWTEREDRLLLTTLREAATVDDATTTASSLIPSKSIDLIRTRFDVLMSLLQPLV